MPGSAGTVRSRRRAEEQAARLGVRVKQARSEMALPRSRIAALAHVAASTVQRVEAGDPSVQLDTLCSVAGAVGLDLVIQAYPGRPPSLRDSGQLALAEMLAAIAHVRLRPALEVRAGEHGESADQVFFGTDEIIHVEIERMLLDFQAQLRAALRKREFLKARHARPIRLVLAVEDTSRNRRTVGNHQAFIRTALPAGSREILQALRTGEPLGRDGVLWIRRRRPTHR
jgi:transcriptional regulator with XRE-family HTH domain